MTKVHGWWPGSNIPQWLNGWREWIPFSDWCLTNKLHLFWRSEHWTKHAVLLYSVVLRKCHIRPGWNCESLKNMGHIWGWIHHKCISSSRNPKYLLLILRISYDCSITTHHCADMPYPGGKKHVKNSTGMRTGTHIPGIPFFLLHTVGENLPKTSPLKPILRNTPTLWWSTMTNEITFGLHAWSVQPCKSRNKTWPFAF